MQKCETVALNSMLVRLCSNDSSLFAFWFHCPNCSETGTKGLLPIIIIALCLKPWEQILQQVGWSCQQGL